MGLGTGATAAIIGGIGAAGAVGSAAIGAHASGSAADKEVAANQAAIEQTQKNQQPYLDLGSSSVAQLMKALQSGQFGPGSTPNFTAPTLQEAEQTPGYQFAQEQGAKGILEASAASGGAISGGTARALESFNTGLANSTYSDRFSQALQTYQATLANQNQQYQQLFAPIGIGETAASGTSANVSQLLQSMGQSQAAGTVGTANAINSGIGGATNSLTSGLLLSQLGQLLKGSSAPSPSPGDAGTLGMAQPAASSLTMPKSVIPPNTASVSDMLRLPPG